MLLLVLLVPGKVAAKALDGETFIGDDNYFMNYTDQMAQQRITDLMRYTKTYIEGKPHVTSVLLSPQARKALGLTEEELLTGKRSKVTP